MATRVQYTVVRSACARGGVLFIVTNSADMFTIWQSIYGADLPCIEVEKWVTKRECSSKMVCMGNRSLAYMASPGCGGGLNQLIQCLLNQYKNM